MITFQSVQCHPGVTYIFNFWHAGTLALSPERQSARMSEIKNVGLTWMAKCNQLTSLPFKELSYSWRKTKHESTSCVCTAFQTHLRQKPTSISGVSTRSNFQPATNSTDSSPGVNRHSRATWNMDRDALLAGKNTVKSSTVRLSSSSGCVHVLVLWLGHPKIHLWLRSLFRFHVGWILGFRCRLGCWRSRCWFFMACLPYTTDAKLCCWRQAVKWIVLKLYYNKATITVDVINNSSSN